MKNLKIFLSLFILINISCKSITEERVDNSGFFKKKCSFIKNTDIKHGVCVQFGSNGDSITKFNYIRNKLDGEQYFFYENGRYESISTYNKDVKEGITKSFYINGNLKYLVEYKKGVLWNILDLKDVNGNSLSAGNFKNGNGFVKVFYDNGEIKYMGEYNNGKPNGNWKYITDTGVEDIKKYNNGIDESGYEISFYE